MNQMRTKTKAAVRSFAIALVLLLVCGTGAFAGGTSGGEQEVVTVRLAVPDPIQSSVGQTGQFFADRVAEVTDGAVKVEVFPDGVLFGRDQNAGVNMVEDGSIDATILSSSVYASFEPRMNAISLPYLFADYDEFISYLEGAPGQELLASLDGLNTVGLTIMIRTFRNVTNSVRPIQVPSDLQGLKLRVPNNRLWVEFFGPLGADPTPMNFSEVYTALQLGTIDGQENPVEVPLANKFYEVQDYLSMTEHIADGFILAFNKDLWESFDEATQDAIQQAAIDTGRFKLDLDLGNEASIIKQLQANGMQVNRLSPEQKAQFQDAALELYPRFEELVGADFVAESLEFLGR
jgi:tripartite ATP-independent transporter DctP family solute receptor